MTKHKNIDYILTIHYRNGGMKEERFPNDEDGRASRLVELSHAANTGNEIERCSLREEEEDDNNNTVIAVAEIASVITMEFGNTILIKTLLSKAEVASIVSRLAASCFQAFRNFPATEGTSQEMMIHKIHDWAKSALWDKHQIKV